MLARYLSALLVAFLVLSFTFSTKTPPDPAQWDENTPVTEVLAYLGETSQWEFEGRKDPDLIRRGYEIVTTGRTTGPDGKRIRRQSRFYVCTDCHNIKREDPDLANPNPDDRLAYVAERGMPFLQASTFYGIINRESWYNDDYEKKYGQAIAHARHSLREAVELCSIQCSQGRYLVNWEVEAIMAYLWTLELKMGDLNLEPEAYETFRKVETGGKRDHREALIQQLKEYYPLKSGANFGAVPEDKAAGYAHEGDAERGKLLYERSCLTCHAVDGPSRYLKLNDGSLSRHFFRSQIRRNNRFSLYEIIRHGTHSEPGHRAYMPNYTLEKMSDRQIEDLRAFFETKN